jgi:hypothetical protein
LIILRVVILTLGSVLLMSLIKNVGRKANFPNMGRSYGEIKDYLRGVPLNGYIILYRVTDIGI